MTENVIQEMLKDIQDGYIDAWDNLAIEELFKEIDKEHKEIQQYRAIGTVEQLKTMFDGFWKLKDLCEEYEKYGLPEDYWKLNEMCKEYSAIGTIEEFKALKEKNEPKKIIKFEGGNKCPVCGHWIGFRYNHCDVCGQKLDWS